MLDIFALRKNPYHIPNICLFGSKNPQSVRFGMDATAFLASQLTKSTNRKKIFFIARNFKCKNKVIEL